MKNTTPDTEVDRLLSVEETRDWLAEKIGVRPDRSTLWHWQKRGLLPEPTRVGLRRIYWFESALRELLRNR